MFIPTNSARFRESGSPKTVTVFISKSLTPGMRTFVPYRRLVPRTLPDNYGIRSLRSHLPLEVLMSSRGVRSSIQSARSMEECFEDGIL